MSSSGVLIARWGAPHSSSSERSMAKRSWITMTNHDSDLPESLAALARRAFAQAGLIRIHLFTDVT
jgi:hypothetical protein